MIRGVPRASTPDARSLLSHLRISWSTLFFAVIIGLPIGYLLTGFESWSEFFASMIIAFPIGYLLSSFE